MAARLNVTEAERLSYSRRKLQAISALRNAELDPVGVLQGKEQRPTHSGRWYGLPLPDGSLVYLPTLRQVVAYAQDYRLYTTTMCLLEAEERISWQRWQRDGAAYALALLVPELRAIARQSPQEAARPAPSQPQPSAPTRCSWPECPYPATGVLDDHTYCAGHAHIYVICQQASKGVASCSFPFSSGHALASRGERSPEPSPRRRPFGQGCLRAPGARSLACGSRSLTSRPAGP